jgi:hypothetical protein
MRSRARQITLAAALLVAGWATGASACERIEAYQRAIASPPAETASTLVVPIVVHILEPPGQPCSVRDEWPSASLVTLFKADRSSSSTVSSVWGVTRIRFVVHEVALHQADPPRDLMSGRDVLTPMTGPLGTPAWEAAFGTLMTRFHQASSINVFLWKTLANDLAGFGRSPRSGNGRATVFLASKCVDRSQMTAKNCARSVAHELGHALGLYHSGVGCSTVQPQFQQICTTTSAPCGESNNDQRLMASGAAGRKLCPLEIKAAEKMTTQLQ